MRIDSDQPQALHVNSTSQDQAVESGLRMLKDIVTALSFAIEAINKASPSDVTKGADFYEQVRRFEIGLIERALKATQGNQAQAARLLKLNQTTLHGKIKQYRIYPAVVLYGEQQSLPGTDRLKTFVENNNDSRAS